MGRTFRPKESIFLFSFDSSIYSGLYSLGLVFIAKTQKEYFQLKTNIVIFKSLSATDPLDMVLSDQGKPGNLY